MVIGIATLVIMNVRYEENFFKNIRDKNVRELFKALIIILFSMAFWPLLWLCILIVEVIVFFEGHWSSFMNWKPFAKKIKEKSDDVQN
jgi:uncharacterized membrane protein